MAKNAQSRCSILAAAATNFVTTAPAATMMPTTATAHRGPGQGHAGTIVQLAPGNYACTPTIPAGVTLRGAGHGKTVLDVGAADVASPWRATGGLSELAVVSQGGTAIRARGVEAIALSGVLVRGGAVGIRLQEVAGVRIENCIVDGSLTGIAWMG